MLKKFKIIIHPLYYVVATICFFTGYFKAFSIYTMIIFIHELGHISAALILKWKILKITVYPFGCMTTFDQKLNSSIFEEFLILLYGPLFQIVFNFIYPTPYHYFILFFNLLPIYPLDGSKFLFLLFNKFFSYYHSYLLTYAFSYVAIFLLLFHDFSFLNIIILIYLFIDVTRYLYKLKDIMMKFYYDCYKYPVNYKRNKIIYNKDVLRMARGRNNFFMIENNLYSQHYILRELFLHLE